MNIHWHEQSHTSTTIVARLKTNAHVIAHSDSFIFGRRKQARCRPCSSVTELPRLVTMSQCSGFTDELDSVLDRDSVSDHGADCAGTVQETAILPAADSSPQQTEDECTHPVIFNSICATYGIS